MSDVQATAFALFEDLARANLHRYLDRSAAALADGDPILAYGHARAAQAIERLITYDAATFDAVQDACFAAARAIGADRV